MAAQRGSRFVLVEIDGWDENELYEAESIEEMTEYLELKGGNR